MKAVVTVIGVDKVGIIAKVSAVLAAYQANILDISQTTMDDMFTMIMMVDVKRLSVQFDELAEKLDEAGKSLGVEVKITHEDIYRSMHRI
jgi:ACT domain-containing protein